MKKYLTIKEAAEKLSVCERTILRYIRSKKLRAAKVGQWRIEENDLALFFNKNANKNK